MKEFKFQKELMLVNQKKKSKECMICCYWYFKDISYRFKLYLCNKYHDIKMMAYELENIAVLNVEGVDYRCVLWKMTKNDGINRLNNSKLHDKGTL